MRKMLRGLRAIYDGEHEIQRNDLVQASDVLTRVRQVMLYEVAFFLFVPTAFTGKRRVLVAVVLWLWILVLVSSLLSWILNRPLFLLVNAGFLITLVLVLHLLYVQEQKEAEQSGWRYAFLSPLFFLALGCAGLSSLGLLWLLTSNLEQMRASERLLVIQYPSWLAAITPPVCCFLGGCFGVSMLLPLFWSERPRRNLRRWRRSWQRAKHWP